MATSLTQSAISVPSAPGRRYDHPFFSAMALLILFTVFAGFAHSYYLAGVFHAPLPNRLVHVHGAVFSGWILLFLVQTLLVSTHRVELHRKLGLFGFGLASLMLVLGVLAASDQLVRHKSLTDALDFYAIPLFDIGTFATVIFFAWRARRNPAAHKRLVLIATIAILDAATARWPIGASWWGLHTAEMASDTFLLLLVGYDLFSLGKIHRATLWAGLFLISLQQLRWPVGHTALWHHFAAWVQQVVG